MDTKQIFLLSFLILILASCEEITNCEEEESAFFRDLCWTSKARENNDVSYCQKLEKQNFVCFGYVAAGLENPDLCSKYADDAKECMRIYNMELLDNKIKKCEDKDELKTQICITNLAKTEDNFDICLRAPENMLCTLDFSEDKMTFEPILKNLYDRDRDIALGIYAATTLEGEALEHITDNRVHDFSVIQAPIIALLRYGKTVAPEYCSEMLRGKYEYDGENTVESEEIMNKNLCLTVAAATESAKRNEDLCGIRLSLSIESYYEEYRQENIDDSVKYCQDLLKKLKAAERLSSAGNFEEYEKLMDIIRE